MISLDQIANFIWTLFAVLNYALADLVVVELASLIIWKYHYFKKSEFYIFLTISLGVLFFLISNVFQNSIIDKIVLWGWWLPVIFILAMSINVFVLAKFELGRNWNFRLVKIPLFIIGFILLFFIGHLILRSAN